MTDAQWEAWCAQPGTDAFGHPWSSWTRNPRSRISDHQADLIAAQLDKRRPPAKKVDPYIAMVFRTEQLELAL